MSDSTIDPRDEFEKVFPIPSHVIRCGKGYACTEYNAWGGHDFIRKWEGWSAAMLHGAEPVTTAYKLPDDFDFDRFNDVTWLDAVASNPHMHSLTTSTIAMVALELNKRLEAGNPPVIPDGWVACSERLPEWSDDVLCATEFDGPGDWRKKVGYWHCGKWVIYGGSWTPTHWMPLPAAPQQEVK